jgi:hypothetical protein
MNTLREWIHGYALFPFDACSGDAWLVAHQMDPV